MMAKLVNRRTNTNSSRGKSGLNGEVIGYI